MTKILEAFHIVRHGARHEDNAPTVSLAVDTGDVGGWTHWDAAFTGCGETERDAFVDAVEQAAAQGWEVEAIEESRLDIMDSYTPHVVMRGRGYHVYVTVRVKALSADEAVQPSDGEKLAGVARLDEMKATGAVFVVPAGRTQRLSEGRITGWGRVEGIRAIGSMRIGASGLALRMDDGTEVKCASAQMLDGVRLSDRPVVAWTVGADGFLCEPLRIVEAANA